MKRADLVVLGKVVRSQGRDGRVKLKLSEKGPTGFSGATVYVQRENGFEAFAVESLTLDRGAYHMKLGGVDTLAAADALAGRDVLAAGSDFRKPGRDSFYDFQVLGCRVVTRAGAEVGRVEATLESGGAVLLVVKRGDGELYVPFNEAICVKVDPEAGEILIDPPDGLLELNEI